MDTIKDYLFSERNINFIRETIIKKFNITVNSLNKTMNKVNSFLNEIIESNPELPSNNDELIIYINFANENTINKYEEFLLNKFQNKNIYRQQLSNDNIPAEQPKIKIIDENQKNELLSKIYKDENPNDKLLANLTDDKFLETFNKYLIDTEKNIFEKNLELYLKENKLKIKKIIDTIELNKLLSRFSKTTPNNKSNNINTQKSFEARVNEIQENIKKCVLKSDLEGQLKYKKDLELLSLELEKQLNEQEQLEKAATKKIEAIKKTDLTFTEEKIDDNKRKIKIFIDPENQDNLRDIKVKLAKDKKTSIIKLLKYKITENQNNITRFNNVFSIYQTEHNTETINIPIGQYTLEDLLDIINDHPLVETSYENEKFFIKSKNNQDFSLIFSKNTILDCLGFDIKQAAGKISYQSTNPVSQIWGKKYTAFLEIDSSSYSINLEKMNEEVLLDSENIIKKSSKGMKIEEIKFRILTNETKKVYDFEEPVELELLVEYTDN